MVLKYIYTLFIGILLALFIGVGIQAFYPSPKLPDYFTIPRMYVPVPNSTDSAQLLQDQKKQDTRMNKYQKNLAEYNRNVSLIALIASIIFLGIGILFDRKMYLITDGFLVGGIVTLIYSIVRGFSANDDIFRFAVVSIGLVIVLYLGYIKFVKPASKNSSKN